MTTNVRALIKHALKYLDKNKLWNEKQNGKETRIILFLQKI